MTQWSRWGKTKKKNIPLIWTYLSCMEHLEHHQAKKNFVCRHFRVGLAPSNCSYLKYSHFPLNHDYGRKSKRTRGMVFSRLLPIESTNRILRVQQLRSAKLTVRYIVPIFRYWSYQSPFRRSYQQKKMTKKNNKSCSIFTSSCLQKSFQKQFLSKENTEAPKSVLPSGKLT